jgi:hypothetical protein
VCGPVIGLKVLWVGNTPGCVDVTSFLGPGRAAGGGPNGGGANSFFYLSVLLSFQAICKTILD